MRKGRFVPFVSVNFADVDRLLCELDRMSIRHCIRGIEERLLCRGNGCLQFFSVEAAYARAPVSRLGLERLNSISIVFFHLRLSGGAYIGAKLPSRRPRFQSR
jgi:hypothetical protein